MLALLPYCRSDVVQQVADVALRPQPPLDQPFYGVYVLCSPKWGKCYVGAFGFEGQRAPILRWKEHIDRCRLWSSETSKARYAGRRSALYAAMAAVGHENVVMVIVAQTTAASLAQQERTYVKALRPVFNIVAMDEDPVLHGQAARILGATTCDDVLSIADKVLRQAKPRLSASSWTALVVATAAAGDRTIAARVARRARMSRPELRKLRALPRLTFPCPVPDTLLRTLQARVRNQLLALPHFDRTVHFYPTLRLGKVSWSRSPMVDAVVAPSIPQPESIGLCQCAGWVGPRHNGHIVTRQWQSLPPCHRLAALCGTESMAQRTFPTARQVADVMRQRMRSWLILCGFDEDTVFCHSF